MPVHRLALTLLLTGIAGEVAAQTCYTVVDRANRTIYQSQDTPLDLSWQIGDTLPSRFPAASIMVIWNAGDSCIEIRDGTGPTAARAMASVRAVRRDRN